MALFSELKRRNVLRMAVLLIGLGALPESTGQWILVLLAIGFPIALIFSWFFEITPEGLSLEKDIAEGQSITRTTGRRMDFVIIAILSAGLILFAWDKWWPRGPQELSIAVLAFENMSPRTGVLLGRHLRGDPQPAGADPGTQGHRAGLVVFVQGQKCRHRDDGAATQGAAHPRGLGTQGRRPGAHYRAADRCQGQQPPLVADL
jgi:hypothetical protein